MNLAQLIAGLIGIVKADALKAALPALAGFFANIAGNPQALNVTAQLAKLNVDLLAALPGLEQDVLKQIAALLAAETQALLAKPA